MSASGWNSQGVNPKKSRARQTVKPVVEPLEDRTLLSRFYQVPGVPGESLPLQATLSGADSSFRSEVGVFVVQDARGRVDGLLPGQPGYARAALQSAQSLFNRGAAVGAQQSLTFAAGTRLGFYLIQNGTRARWMKRNPRNVPGHGPLVLFSFVAANPDGTGHVRRRALAAGGGRWSWEDATGRGDGDFNDRVVTIRPGQPLSAPLLLAPVVPPTNHVALAVAAALVHDTGASAADRITSDPTVRITAAGPFSRVWAGLDATPSNQFADISPHRQPDGSFVLDQAALEQALGGTLGDGDHTLHTEVWDSAGNGATFDLPFLFDTTPPTMPTLDLDPASDTGAAGDGRTTLGAINLVGRSDPGTEVTLTSAHTEEQVVNVGGRLVRRQVTVYDTRTATAEANGRFRFEGVPLLVGPNQFSLQAADLAGNTTATTGMFTRSDSSDPVEAAPPINPTAVTTVASGTAFLYTGDNPIQTGVAPDTIDPVRAAVIRGRVTDRDGNPLGDVTITTPNHPEYGQTRTRADGMFDLAVNGGETLTVSCTLDGYLPVQRQGDVPWQDFSWLPDVMMVPFDTQATTVDLDAATPVQVARGSAVTDDDGTRQATLLFTEGTHAEMVLPDGRRQALTTLTVRATEYTVGQSGPAALPGPLPPSSAYTYCVELSVDEAEAAGATQVTFDHPVPFYVENFLHFPVGENVPVGYYDRQQGVWVASDNGRVLEILAVANGLAELDIDGDAVADDATELAALGITDPERERLADLYAAGQSLWRVPVAHFTPWDCNSPLLLPDDATGADQPPPERHAPEDESCEESGSIIDVGNQALGERLPVVGTPFTLNYRSDRTPGRQEASNRLEIPLSGASIPASLRRIELEVLVAGQRFTRSFAAAPNLTYTFVWDGRDGYGRVLQGEQQATIRIGYSYGAVGYLSAGSTARSFARFSELQRASGGRAIITDGTRQEYTIWQERQVSVGYFDASTQGLAGWSLDVQHVYDPVGQVLYLGDGTRQSGTILSQQVIEAAAAARSTTGFAVGPDGTLYVADTFNNRVNRVVPDGTVTAIVGTGAAGFNGDSEASQTRLNSPSGLAAGPGGSYQVTFRDDDGTLRTRTIERPILYIADTFNNRIREVVPSGDFLFVVTIAGDGTAGYDLGIPGVGPDDIPATFARLNRPSAVAVGPDGSLYVSDTGNHRIRRIGPDGIIITVAGTGVAGFNGDGMPATRAELNSPSDLAVGPDGSLYIADTGNQRIRRVAPDGTITTLAGTGTEGFSPDGTIATQAALRSPAGVAWGKDGILYFSDTGNNLVRRVTLAGALATVAGASTLGGFGGENGPATQALLRRPTALDIAPDGSLLVADTGNGGVRRVASALPQLSGFETLIPSQDGSEVYRFDAGGRHLETRSAFTGATLYSFGYDALGRLRSITDADNNVTTIERDAAGNPTAIVAPFGQRTTLTLDADGYLAAVTNPANEVTQFTYRNGLMATETDPRGGMHHFTYEDGLLVRDEDPAGGFKTLARTETDEGHQVTLTTAEGQVTTHADEHLAGGGQHRVMTWPDGTRTAEEIAGNGTRTLTAADGTVVSMVLGPDPRWGMQAPMITSLTTTTPGGLTARYTMSRTVTLDDPSNPLTLQMLTNTVTVNGRTYTSTFEVAAGRFTVTSPEGRQATSTVDARGRLLGMEMADLEPVNLTYDARGRLIDVAQGTGTAGRTVTLGYDAQGRLATLTDPLTQTASFEYDSAGRVVRQVLPDGREILLDYDRNGSLTSLTTPGEAAHTFDHTATGLVAEYRPPDLGTGTNATRYSYNLDRQLTQLLRPDGRTIDLAYDSAGRTDTVTLPNGQIRYAYDPLTGQLRTVTAPDGGTLSYTYDGGLLTRSAWAGTIQGSVSRTYNNDFQLSSMSVDDAHTVAFQYDRDGLLTRAGDLTVNRSAESGFLQGTVLGGVTTSLDWNGFGELEEERAGSGSGDVFAVRYVRDALGQVTEKTETIGGVTDTYGYGYDRAGRLTSVTRNGVLAAAYTYDANGNRLAVTGAAGTVVGTYDAQDRLTRYGTTDYTYTANGELRSKTEGGQTTAYEYNVLGGLRSVTLPNGARVEYLLDGHGRRIGKEVNGTLVQGFLYGDGLRPVAELDGSNNVVSRFVYATKGNVPDYMEKGGRTYRLISDQLGSVRLVIDAATGAVAQRLDYDEFGNVTLDTNPGFQPFGFAGGIYDRDTHLTRFGARDYDAQTGRWTTKDPSGFSGGMNFYRYADNDPVNLIDRTGLAPGKPPNNPDANNANQAPRGRVGDKLIENGKVAGGEGKLAPVGPTKTGGTTPSLDQNGNPIPEDFADDGEDERPGFRDTTPDGGPTLCEQVEQWFDETWQGVERFFNPPLHRPVRSSGIWDGNVNSGGDIYVVPMPEGMPMGPLPTLAPTPASAPVGGVRFIPVSAF